LIRSTLTYIALGSNQGDKEQRLQESVDLIFERIGAIQSISKVYHTPAWGFKGEPFLNACISVRTNYSAEVVLKLLLEIEVELGRTRTNNDGYVNRVIDLDIIFYGDLTISSKKLHVPHPQLAYRKFVLYPMADIAADLIHPINDVSIRQLMKETSDDSSLYEVDFKLTKPQLPDLSLNYLVIEGNIGAGKTTLCKMIEQDYQAKAFLERYHDNPFLPKFYKNKKRYAFPLELSFLADRHQQLVEEIGQFDLFRNFAVADYDFYKPLIFARITLHQDEYQLYKRLFDVMYKELPKPDLYVYLYQNTDKLLQNIKKRGRDYEQNIDAQYLNDLHKGYMQFIRQQNYLKTEIIDLSNLNFVENRLDYIKLIYLLHKMLPHG
jgi:2-amino-4-hydroxy-6-hydroxymethyldihydropteridine diphosphokinase